MIGLDNEVDRQAVGGPRLGRPDDVLLSCAMSVDGYIDGTSPERLLLSNAEDFDRVDEVRASCDAILIGANTVRKNNPRLLVNSPERRAERERRGMPAYPVEDPHHQQR